ncbi:unnamed protein product [Boreogadus saida]
MACVLRVGAWRCAGTKAKVIIFLFGHEYKAKKLSVPSLPPSCSLWLHRAARSDRHHRRNKASRISLSVCLSLAFLTAAFLLLDPPPLGGTASRAPTPPLLLRLFFLLL